MERYQRLRGWALKLVLGNQQQADDLLHDAFIHFMLHRAATEQAQNLDAYLHTMLRNLHLSQARRLARTPQGHLSLLDYDSADLGLQSVDPRDQMKSQDELRMICRYACLRKQSSKAASALILRYFYGYYPVELARLLNSPRMGIDGLLRNARAEARLFLQDPESLTFMRRETLIEPPAIRFGRVAPDILAELRQTIFASRNGECLSTGQLDALYAPKPESSIDAPLLSHLASCENCLDEVNRRLGWPSLQTRQTAETTGRDPRSKGGGGDAGGGGLGETTFLKRSRRRTKQVFEHHPKELHISVNGFVLGTQIVSSRHSELTLNLNLDEKVAFVEVYSERDVRLFFLNVEMPPDGPVDQLSSVELSEGRALDLALNFSDARPRLHAVYSDPTLAEVEDAEVSSLKFQVSSGDEIEVQSPKSKVQSLLHRVANLWDAVRSRDRGFGPWTLDFGRPYLGLFSRPAVVTVLVAAILAGALLVWKTRTPVESLTAASLLNQAVLREQALVTKSNQVIHQSINLEVSVPRAVATGSASQLIARNKIEVWQSADRGLVTRRLYDEKGLLIAGDWRRFDGVQTLYHHGRRPQLQIRNSKFEIRNFDEVWQIVPSARDFSSLFAGSQQVRVETSRNSYILSCEPGGCSPGAHIYKGQAGQAAVVVKAELTLNRADLRPIGQILVLKLGDELREYRFVETAFETTAPSAVNPGVFEPEPELLSSAKPETPNSKLETGAPASGTGNPAPLIATPELEVEVLGLLHRAGADLGEQVIVTRTRDGQLRIEGLVDTDQRKAQLVRALESVRSNPAVRIEVNTVAEVMKRQAAGKSSPESVVVERQAEGSRPLTDSDLRRFFSAKGLSSEQVDREVTRFANRAVNRSLQVMVHAGAMKRLGERFSAEQLHGLTPEARAKLLAIVRVHAQSVRQETAALRQQLQPVFPSATSSVGEDSMAISSDADLLRAIERLFEICAANDRMVSSAFAIKASGPDTSDLRGPQFWRSLRRAEQLAEAIQSRL